MDHKADAFAARRVFKQGLVDGGRAGLVWSFVWSVAGFVPVYLSLAEMASM